MTFRLAQENKRVKNIHNQPIERAQELVRAFREDTDTASPTFDALSPDHANNLKTWLETTTVPIQKFHLRAHINEPTDGHRWVIGTEEWADVRLPDHDHSPFYFMVERAGNDWLLNSLDDMPPLYVNGKPVRAAQMKDGDEINTENFLFIFDTQG